MVEERINIRPVGIREEGKKGRFLYLVVLQCRVIPQVKSKEVLEL